MLCTCYNYVIYIESSDNCFQEFSIREQEVSSYYFYAHELHDCGGVMAHKNDEPYQEPDVEGKHKL